MKCAARVGICTTLLASTAGCGYLFSDDGVFRDTSEDYKKAPETAVIKVPEGKQVSALEEIYPIPAVQDQLLMAGEFEVPRPTPLVGGAADEVVRIQSLGDESWALVAIAPGQLWPQVRGFLAAAGIQVGRLDARAGIMETNWLQLDGQDMSSRFRFRIEQGVQRGSSELHVLQMNQAGDINRWPKQSDNLAQEGEMLKAVAQFIANSADTAPVSMIAEQAMSAVGKVSMQEAPEGYTYISLGLPFGRAWASLAKALEDSSFEIEDRDRSAGTYYVRYLGPSEQEEGGWFSWLFGSDEHPLKNKSFELLVTEDTAEQVAIRLRSSDPAYDKRQEQALLAIIKGNIR
ncbi:outer membrane protein assembly factor BamC [Parahaliea sp. F7430]|uniref:Outer membrane protein assembly factor BamC n=2 Tax=Sediminihaliea albiluteola TaxID=2758564 RepID=A0A7W2TVP9_9GAMM|nr:outer membrane protein assembly factor BamC [Sediminihaliea albiluteola]